MSYTLVEPCCGSAALTLHMLGAKRSIVPYQGSKWRYRREIAGVAARLGFDGAPSRVVLTDAGPWGRVIGSVLDRERRAEIIKGLRALSLTDPRQVFDGLHGVKSAQEPVAFAVEFLFLQRLAALGKAVGLGDDGQWKSPGFNSASAYGKPATERFGAISPMIPSMVRAIRSYNQDLSEVEVVAAQQLACLPESIDGHTLVYIDPSYQGTTGYPHGGMTRDELHDLAEGWRELGAAVIVSEGEPLQIDGWDSEQIAINRRQSSKGSSGHEWVTYAGGDA